MLTDQALHEPAFAGSFESLDGRELFVRRSNPDDPHFDLVMVHGLGGMSLNWTDLMHLQAVRGRSSVALDLPGFGRSLPQENQRYSLVDHAAAVIALIETNDSPVHLVGNSLGGAISTMVAARRPDLVQTLTLSAPALPHIKPSLERLPIIMGILPRADDILRRLRGGQSPEQRLDDTMTLVYGDPSRISPHRREEALHEYTLRHEMPHVWQAFVASARGLGRGFLPWGDQYLWRQLDEVQAPVLAVFGTQDRLVDAAIAKRVAGTIGGGTVVVLPGIGHVPQMEVPVTVDRLLDAHILGQL